MDNYPCFINKTQQVSQKLKVGDTVVITNPVVVDRVGYPLSRQMALEIVEQEYEVPIKSLLEQTGLYKSIEDKVLGFTISPDWPPSGRYQKAYSRLISALASMYLENNSFGGNTRSIYSHEEPDLLGKNYSILEKRIVKTGEYYPPSYIQMYDGEVDYEPAGLKNSKTHILLCLEWRFALPKFDKYDFSDSLWIESSNLRRV